MKEKDHVNAIRQKRLVSGMYTAFAGIINSIKKLRSANEPNVLKYKGKCKQRFPIGKHVQRGLPVSEWFVEWIISCNPRSRKLTVLRLMCVPFSLQSWYIYIYL